jgi:alpha-tubulin suppressor-like RCC1 family protein
VPAPNADWVDIAVFDEQSVGLKSDGTVQLWGEIELAAPEPDSLFVKIAAGYAQALALTEHGSIAHFG